MSEEWDTWPPRVGQHVWVKPLGVGADIVELLPLDQVLVELHPTVGELYVAGETRRRYALEDLRPEYPHCVPEWQGTFD